MSLYQAVTDTIRKLGVIILAISSNTYLIKNRVLTIPKNDKDTNDNDILFLMLHLSAHVIFINDDEYEQEKKSVMWAIDKSKQIGLKITQISKDDIQKRLNNIKISSFTYNLSSIYDENTIIKSKNNVLIPIKNNNICKKNTIIPMKKQLINNFCNNNTVSIIDDKQYNLAIKKRIQANDTFNEYNVDESILLNHQKAGCLLARRYNKFAYFYDTGTGKTVMTLAIIAEKYKLFKIKFMIISPLPIIKTAWLEDSKQYFPYIRILPLSNNFNKKDYYKLYIYWEKNDNIPDSMKISHTLWNNALLCSSNKSHWNIVWDKMKDLSQHYIINIEKYRRAADVYNNEFETSGLILDESGILKNYSSKTSKVMLSVAKSYRYIYLLSGKPAPNNSTEYYTQMKMVDPISFCMSNHSYINRYFIKDNSTYFFLNDASKNTIANLISNRSLIVSKEDCLNLPKIFYVEKSVKLSNKDMKYYNEMFKGCLSTIIKQEQEFKEKQIHYFTGCKLAILTKLREISSGFFIDEYKDIFKIHQNKINTLIEIVESNINEPILIWCQFSYEIETIEKVLSKYGTVVTAYGKSKNTDENIKAFKYGKAKYMIAHPKSIKYGVTFINCCTSIYYSLSYSAEDYYQSRDRIYRLGQKRDCTYYFLLANDTIDEIMLECIKKKMTYAEIFQSIIKQAAKHGIDYSKFKNQINIQERKSTIASQKIIDKYKFSIIEPDQFMYELNGEVYQNILYNKMLCTYTIYRPEEMLFEIGKNIIFPDIDITYNIILKIVGWVLKELKKEKITIVNHVSEYLNEQMTKQYEIEIAQSIRSDTSNISMITSKDYKKILLNSLL